MTEPAHVAIVGGGLMGASLGLLLSRCLPDYKVVLCERSPEAASFDRAVASPPSFDMRSTALSPSSVDMLQRLGVWEVAQNGATPIRTIQVSDKGNPGWVKLRENDNHGDPLGYVVENASLGRALMHGVANQDNLELLSPAEVRRVEFRTSHALLHFEGTSPAPLQSKLVIVADGANSLLRSQLGIGVEVRDYDQSAVVANVRCSQEHECVAYERFTAAGPLAMLPLHGVHGSVAAMVWTWPQTDVQEAMTLADDEFLARLQSTFGRRLGRFLSVSERSVYPLRRVIAREQVRRRLVLMGNAAHFLHPVAGQGFNLAARDGLRLADLLVQAEGRDPGDLALLKRYEQAQAPDQWRTTTLSHSFNQWFANSNSAATVLRNGAMALVQTQGAVRTGFIRQMSGRSSPRATPWRQA